MKKVSGKMAAQGDVLFVMVNDLPSDAVKEKTESEPIVAHSQTGHHHIACGDDVAFFKMPQDPFTCYLRSELGDIDIVHKRPHDTHETIRLPAGTWMVRRQREHTPEGWRMVQD